MQYKSTMTRIEIVRDYLLTLQKKICQSLEIEDGGVNFSKKSWLHNEGGGGLTRIAKNGNIIEKAGVNFSHIIGTKMPASATRYRPEIMDSRFEVLGISLVVHPLNPYVPTSHANLRFFISKKKSTDLPMWWFGGGFDLTPYYPFEEDCIHWHRMAERACLPFGKELYPQYKSLCDDYFYIKHRNEPRGVGGIFFDDLNLWGFSKCFSFVQSIGSAYIDAYLPIMQRRKLMEYTIKQREFQKFRRGRYVEFNLVHDRGTLFGLQSGGRIESILMSLPPEVTWYGDQHYPSDTEEGRLTTYFLQNRDWLGYSRKKKQEYT